MRFWNWPSVSWPPFEPPRLLASMSDGLPRWAVCCRSLVIAAYQVHLFCRIIFMPFGLFANQAHACNFPQASFIETGFFFSEADPIWIVDGYPVDIENELHYFTRLPCPSLGMNRHSPAISKTSDWLSNPLAESNNHDYRMFWRLLGFSWDPNTGMISSLLNFLCVRSTWVGYHIQHLPPNSRRSHDRP